MCYPKPGPRCYAHTHNERVAKESQLEEIQSKYASSIEELQKNANSINRLDAAYEEGQVDDEEYNRYLDGLSELRRNLADDAASYETHFRALQTKVRNALVEEHATKKGLKVLKAEVEAATDAADKRAKQLDYARAERLYKHRHDAYQAHLEHQKKSREYKEKSNFLKAEASAIEAKDNESKAIRDEALLEAEKFEAQAYVESQDGKYHFPALFDKDGNLVPAKIIKTKFGVRSWGILLDPSKPSSSKMAEFISISKHSDPKKREKFYADKGYTVGKVMAPAVAAIVDDEKAGKKRVTILRSDGGYSPAVEVLTKNQYENIPATS
jgi:hypothetical protein